MSETIFAVSNLIIMPFWLSMIVFPGRLFTARLLSYPWICGVLALLYGLLVIPAIPELLPLLLKPELPSIQKLLSTPLGATAGWLHFLCFDLFVGRWIWQDSLDRNGSRLHLRLSLALTLMFGPLGLLGYAIGRSLGWPAFAKSLNPLVRQASLMIPLIALCLLGLALDPRVLLNSAVWLKPLKFVLSVLIYNLTMDQFLSRIEHRWTARLGKLTSGCFSLELIVIFLQAARGTRSHFNQDTPLDACLFALMGIGILALWLVAMVSTALIWRHGKPEVREPLSWAMLIAVVGMGIAWPMTAAGQHCVGGPDGGPGLPILGWSTQFGDLRAPHFFGLHALQIVPILWLVARRWGPSLCRVVGPAYLLLVLLLTRQAMLGQPIVSLDLELLGWMGFGLASLLLLKARHRSPAVDV
jgi:hypothetical protein